MAELINFAPVRGFTANGDPVPGGKARFYAPGTTTPVDVYTTSALNIAHPVPVVADANGYFPVVWAPTAVKCVVTDADGNTLYTLDPTFRTPDSAAAAASVSFEPTPEISADNVQDAIEEVQAALTAETQRGWTYSASQATTSGTAFDFTGVPSWATEVIVLFNGVSLNGTNNVLVQVGTSGGLVITGYTSATTRQDSGANVVGSSTSGFVVSGGAGTQFLRGTMRMVRFGASGNDWVSDHAMRLADGTTSVGGGTVTLTGALDRVRVTRNTTDSFDAGSVMVAWR